MKTTVITRDQINNALMCDIVITNESITVKVKGEKEMRWEHVREGLSFSDALMALKAGKKIAREGWNGKGMYVVYRSGYPEGIPANKNTADAIGIPEGSLFKVRPYLQMRCADGSFQIWLASQSDILEDDWQIVE